MVDFQLSDENRLVQQAARAFAEAEILPHIREWDEKGEVHRELFAKMAEQGFLGAPIPEAWGGAGMDYLSFAILCEELERADTAFRVVQSVHVGLNSLALLQWATDEQKRRWLVPQAKGEKLATFGLTEPGVGTDAANLATTARRDGDALPPQRPEDLDQPGRPRRPLPRLRLGRSLEGLARRDGVPARARDGRASRPGRSTASSASGPATPG